MAIAGCLKNAKERLVTRAALKTLQWTAITRKSAKSTGTATKGQMDWVEIKHRTMSNTMTHLTSKPLQGLAKDKMSHHWQLQGV